MTHTAHRRAHQIESDYVLQLRSRPGFNRENAGEKLRLLLNQIEALGPVNFGDPASGSTLRTSREKFKENINDSSNLHIVFKDTESAQKAVEIIKKMDTGLSVTLTGPLDCIRTMASEMGLEINSIQIDLGTIGKNHFNNSTGRILSLCGHMRVSEYLVTKMRGKIKEGEIDADSAAREIGKVCKCGCFNPHAAAQLLSCEDGEIISSK